MHVNTYLQMFREDDLHKRGVLHCFRENSGKEETWGRKKKTKIWRSGIEFEPLR